MTRLRGTDGGGPELGGTQVLAVAGRPLVPVRAAGRLVGFAWEDAHARWCWLGAITPPDPRAPRPAQAEAVFALMESALAAAGMRFGHVVRTWFYNHRILDWYAEFNRVRTDFFRARGVFDALVPASTGVGMPNAAGAALAADLLAVAPKGPEVAVREVPSPLQGPAPAYGSSFSRAVEIAAPSHRRLLVSGTASIAPDGRSVHAGDADAQIDLTLDVVAAILDSRGMGWGDVIRGTAYFKRAADAPRLDARRRARGAGDLHVVCAEADVCRDDLLFEIEVDACRRQGP
jgi:enamine deaminase RidA (YjgF/YER057c/UK114 family)